MRTYKLRSRLSCMGHKKRGRSHGVLESENVISPTYLSWHTNLSGIDVLHPDANLQHHIAFYKIHVILPVLPIDTGCSALSHILSCCHGRGCWLGHLSTVHPYIFLYSHLVVLELQHARKMLGWQAHWMDERNWQRCNRSNYSRPPDSCRVATQFEPW